MSGLRSVGASLRVVAANASLRRLTVAGLASRFGDMAYATAIALYAHQQGGVRGALTTFGGLVGLCSLALLRRFRGLDVELRPPAELAILGDISLFASLDVATLERLARRVTHVSAPAGTTIVAEGEYSDRFYLIVDGQVEVTQASPVGSRFLRYEGPGEFFGEIGVLRDIPRTATVTAQVDTALLAIGRDDFIEAISGRGESLAIAEDAASHRLAF